MKLKLVVELANWSHSLGKEESPPTVTPSEDKNMKPWLHIARNLISKIVNVVCGMGCNIRNLKTKFVKPQVLPQYYTGTTTIQS